MTETSLPDQEQSANALNWRKEYKADRFAGTEIWWMGDTGLSVRHTLGFFLLFVGERCLGDIARVLSIPPLEYFQRNQIPYKGSLSELSLQKHQILTLAQGRLGEIVEIRFQKETTVKQVLARFKDLVSCGNAPEGPCLNVRIIDASNTQRAQLIARFTSIAEYAVTGWWASAEYEFVRVWQYSQDGGGLLLVETVPPL